MLYYDYVLTFPQEVKYIWKGSKRSLLIVLYILCRYALLANVLYLLAIANKLGGPSSCDVAYKVIGVVSVLGRAAVICESSPSQILSVLVLRLRPVTFLARVYVVCARNKLIVSSLGAIAVTCVVLDIVSPGITSFPIVVMLSLSLGPRTRVAMQRLFLDTDVRRSLALY